MNKFGQNERVPTQAASASEPRVAPSVIRSDIAFERHYSVHDLVGLWGLSEKTIRRMFTDEPGVLEWGHEEERYKRPYKTLRIPESVAARVHRRMRKIS